MKDSHPLVVKAFSLYLPFTIALLAVNKPVKAENPQQFLAPAMIKEIAGVSFNGPRTHPFYNTIFLQFTFDDKSSFPLTR